MPAKKSKKNKSRKQTAGPEKRVLILKGEMEEYAKQHKNIVYRMRTIGGPDFEIELIVKDVFEMRQILNEIKKRFSSSINHHKIHRFEYTIKQIYLPGEKI
jgi:hypothetical protein